MSRNNFPNNMNSANTFPNSIYAPLGINDNNFNRSSVPSNIYPMNGGMTGNPIGRFNPISTNTQSRMNNTTAQSNFNEAFTPNQPIVDRLNYQNKGQLLHNNIGDQILDEHVVEYRIYIDSLDRDIITYPDPFSFTVKFNPPSASRIQHEEPIDYKNKSKGTKIVETRFEGLPAPHITKEFKNVKYIKLENVILPKFNKLILKKTGDGFEFDQTSNLTNDRYVSLVIKELGQERYYSTSEGVTRISPSGKCYTPPTPFALIVPDKYLGFNFFTGIPYYGSKIYKNSDLGNITQLTIQFFDSAGLPIKVTDLFTNDDLQEYEFDNGEPLPITDLRHPLNKEIQINLSFVIGVVESQINNLTKFDY